MFPKYKGIFFKRPDEWKDRGEVGSYTFFREKEKAYREVVDKCSYCKHIIHIGIENENLFKFCPFCLCKIKE